MAYEDGSIKFYPFNLHMEFKASKVEQAASVKSVVTSYPEIFSTFKRTGTSVPGLLLNSDIVKNLKVKTK